MSFQAIRSAIGAKLETLTGDGNPLAQVYDYHKIGVDGYPAATFEPSSLGSAFDTNTQNLRTYAFDVVIQQEMSTKERGDAIGILVAAADLVIGAFDSDYTLGGSVDMIEAVPAEFGEIEAEDGVICYAKVTLRCKLLQTV